MPVSLANAAPQSCLSGIVVPRNSPSSISHLQRCVARCSSRIRRRTAAPTVSQFGSEGFFGADYQPDEDNEVITFFTADGVVQLPTRRFQKPQVGRARPVRDPLPTWEEQGLCLGATFYLAATNGFDPTRRINVYGFCRCIDSLSEVIEDNVVRRGGEVMFRESEPTSGFHERLRMTVAVPLLNGVPPQWDFLRWSINAGGGVIESVKKEWQIY